MFCELRDALRLSDEELPVGPRPPETRLQAIAADFQRYHQDLRRWVASRAFAELDRQEPTGAPRLERTDRNAELGRRNRAWAKHAPQGMEPLNPLRPPSNLSPPPAR